MEKIVRCTQSDGALRCFVSKQAACITVCQGNLFGRGNCADNTAHTKEQAETALTESDNCFPGCKDTSQSDGKIRASNRGRTDGAIVPISSWCIGEIQGY